MLKIVDANFPGLTPSFCKTISFFRYVKYDKLSAERKQVSVSESASGPVPASTVFHPHNMVTMCSVFQAFKFYLFTIDTLF